MTSIQRSFLLLSVLAPVLCAQGTQTQTAVQEQFPPSYVKGLNDLAAVNWARVQSSKDPVDLELYALEYPTSQYSQTARMMAMELRRSGANPRSRAGGTSLVDLPKYCQTHYGAGVLPVNRDLTGDGWKCRIAPQGPKEKEMLHEVSIDQACKEQYGATFRAVLLTLPPGGQDDWRCQAQPAAAAN